jgi:hypothetical protein
MMNDQREARMSRKPNTEEPLATQSAVTRRGLLGAGLAAGVAAMCRERNAWAVDETPTAELTNGLIRAKIYLPDPEKGYYRGTRFDWSGVIGSLEYAGHNYYGPWFNRIDPPVRDFTYAGSEIVVGRASGVTGPAQEFSTGQTALGFEEAEPGGTFVKIGVGVLRKPKDGQYERFGMMELVDAGKWQVRPQRSSIDFQQEVSDPGSGYGCRYQKRVQLVEKQPQMVMEHTLRNTGKKPIRSEVYNHNFLVLDGLPPGPDFVISAPFVLKAERPLSPELAEVRDKQILFRKTLEGRDTVFGGFEGFSDSAKEYDFRIDNRRAGAGVRVTGDRPLSQLALWSIRTNISIEPFIRVDVDPGKEFTWKYTYEYYTLPKE